MGKDTLSNVRADKKIPLPPKIRTVRNTPRVIALAVVLLWLVIFVYSLPRIINKQTAALTPIDALLERGTRNWALVTRDSKQSCLAHFSVSLPEDKKLSIQLQGDIGLRVFGQCLVEPFFLNVIFTKLRTLERLEGELSLGRATFGLNTSLKDSEQLEIFLRSEAQKELFSSTHRLPQPIYLADRGPGQFSLHLPAVLKDLSLVLKDSSQTQSKVSYPAIIPLPEEGSAECISQIHSLCEQNRETLLDLSLIIKLLLRDIPAEDLFKPKDSQDDTTN